MSLSTAISILRATVLSLALLCAPLPVFAAEAAADGCCAAEQASDRCTCCPDEPGPCDPEGCKCPMCAVVVIAPSCLLSAHDDPGSRACVGIVQVLEASSPGPVSTDSMFRPPRI